MRNRVLDQFPGLETSLLGLVHSHQNRKEGREISIGSVWAHAISMSGEGQIDLTDDELPQILEKVYQAIYEEFEALKKPLLNLCNKYVEGDSYRCNGGINHLRSVCDWAMALHYSGELNLLEDSIDVVLEKTSQFMQGKPPKRRSAARPIAEFT